MIYIVTIVFALWLLYSHRNQYWLLGRFLIALLLATLIFGCFLYRESPQMYNVDILSSIVFCSAWWLFISPFLCTTPLIDNSLSPKFDIYLTRFVYTISLIILACEFIDIPYLVQALLLNAADVRAAMADGESLVNIPARSVPAYAFKILSLCYPLSYIFLLLFFFYFTFIEKRYYLKIALLLSSLCSIYYGVFASGRTNLIYWILTFVACISIFLPDLRKQKTKFRRIVWVFIFVAVVLTIYFVNTTVGRFEFSEGGVKESLLEYSGKSFLVFNDFFQNFPPGHFSLRRIFPFLSEIFGGSMSLTEYRTITYAHSHMEIGTFYTLLGDLFVDIGTLGLYLYAFVYYLVSKNQARRPQMNIADLMILMVLYLIPLQGIFYYSYWRPQVTVCMIIVVIVANFLKKNSYANN